jgi:hypothetical protein
MLWVKVAVPITVSPSTVLPMKVYTPSGNRARNSSSGRSESDGSSLSKKNSERPSCPRLPLALTSRMRRPSGVNISRLFQASPSRKTWTPTSWSVELYSM